MARTARASVGGICYHVINRGNRRATVFHCSADYWTFIALMGRACNRLPMRVVSYCLMPNHFHLVLWPHRDGDLSRWMQWLLTAHVRRYHRIRGSTGRVWQGRFKAFPIQNDRHLLTVMRYVERNPVRANLVANAIDWYWSSARGISDKQIPDTILDAGPITRPEDWLAIVDSPESEAELTALRRCTSRNSPFGDRQWRVSTAKRLGLESSLRPIGRPKKRP